jgi:hypothetical protein
MRETFEHYTPQANIRVSREDNGEVLFEQHNVIVNVCKWLFARLMANSNPSDAEVPNQMGFEVKYGVWGLALGAGATGLNGWAAETQPVETPSQTALIAEFVRKPLSKISFVDENYNPVSTLSTLVDFQTVVNATTDNIIQPIREMGLIGGGSFNGGGTDMYTAPYFNGNPGSYSSVAAAQNTVILVNYKTLPPLVLPPSVNIIFSWVLSF